MQNFIVMSVSRFWVVLRSQRENNLPLHPMKGLRSASRNLLAVQLLYFGLTNCNLQIYAGSDRILIIKRPFMSNSVLNSVFDTNRSDRRRKKCNLV